MSGEESDEGELDEDRNRESELSDEQLCKREVGGNAKYGKLLIVHQVGRQYHHKLFETGLNENHEHQLVALTSLNKY